MTPHPIRILIVEDDSDITELIRFQLSSLGHHVTAASDGHQALELIHNSSFDVFILDWMLPGISGIDICKKLRAEEKNQTAPIIMITALSQPENIISGLDAGADDYLVKPFDIEVLEARVRAQLRRLSSKKQSSELFDFGDLVIDKRMCSVKSFGQEVALTSTEFKIITLLAETPGHVFTREQFIEKIQGQNIFVTGRTIDTHVAGLRKKLGEGAKYIETIRGIGYRFRP